MTTLREAIDAGALYKSFRGRRIRLAQDIELRSGKKYKKGTCWVVLSTWRGKFNLRRWGSSKSYVNHVPPYMLELR